jgi:hypothetical protein
MNNTGELPLPETGKKPHFFFGIGLQKLLTLITHHTCEETSSVLKKKYGFLHDSCLDPLFKEIYREAET